MDKKDIIMGSTAGGVNALKELVKSFPVDFKASVFIVQHLAADTESHLPAILSDSGPLMAFHPRDGEPVRQGCIYIAPPDHHMIIEKGHIQVKRGPKEDRFRPSINASMRSVAYHYGPRVIGVLVTGRFNESTSGLWSVKQLGGTIIVQNPGEQIILNLSV